jgi:hypothetical protein
VNTERIATKPLPENGFADRGIASHETRVSQSIREERRSFGVGHARPQAKEA